MSIDDQIQEITGDTPEGYSVCLIMEAGGCHVECDAGNLVMPFQTIQGDDILQMVRDGVQACIDNQKNN